MTYMILFIPSSYLKLSFWAITKLIIIFIYVSSKNILKKIQLFENFVLPNVLKLIKYDYNILGRKSPLWKFVEKVLRLQLYATNLLKLLFQFKCSFETNFWCGYNFQDALYSREFENLISSFNRIMILLKVRNFIYYALPTVKWVLLIVVSLHLVHKRCKYLLTIKAFEISCALDALTIYSLWNVWRKVSR